MLLRKYSSHLISSSFTPLFATQATISQAQDIIHQQYRYSSHQVLDPTDSTTDTTNISLLEDENNDVDEGEYLSSSIHESLTEVEDHTDYIFNNVFEEETHSNFHKGMSPLPQHELHLSESNKYCNVQVFDIIAGSTSITIYGIDLYINMATIQDIEYTSSIEIYTKLGSYQGSGENRNDWTLIKSSSDVTVLNSTVKCENKFE